jgi:hypothetical protein
MTSAAEAESMLRPPPDGFLEMVAVSDSVNKVANDGPDVQAAPKAIEVPQPKVAQKEADTRQGDLF